MTSRAFAGLALLLVANAEMGAAQAAAWPPPRGERVRLSTPTLPVKRRIAEYRAFGHDSLFIARGADSIGFPALVVSRVQVPDGTRRHMVMGGVLGLTAGAALGFVLPRLVFGPYSNNCDWFCPEDLGRAMARFLVGVTLSSGGLVIGLRTAWKHPSTRWRTVPMAPR